MDKGMANAIAIAIAIVQFTQFANGQVSPSLLCTAEFCKDQIAENECPNVPENCSAQNSTHSGQWLPAPSFCNCCPYCLSNLGLNERCTQGGLGSPPTGTVCGPGLFCSKAEGSFFRCQRMKSLCHSAQDAYDQKRELGQLGFLEERPTCDGKGDYGAIACIPGQTCFCMNKEGKRIFGELINEQSASKDMTCGCSRVANDVEQLLNGKFSHSVRCLSNGSYDEMQCVQHRCFCVFKDSGLISSNVIIDGDSQSLKNLPCFNEEIHNELFYLNPCEEKKLEILEMMRKYEEEGFTYFGDPIPDCQPDGNFYKIQTQGTRRICVTEKGDQIENYGALIAGSTNMNCNCARTKHLLTSIAGAHFIPDCCPNGNWKPLQCRQNKCYCVDDDGRQTKKEEDIADKDLLSCKSC